MPTKDTHVSHADLEGSELHHELKNQPGKDGDKTHADDAGSTLPDDADKVVKHSDADTQIADQLREIRKQK